MNKGETKLLNCCILVLSIFGTIKLPICFVQIWGKEVWSSDSSYIDSSITPNIYFWYLFLKNKQDVIFDSQSGSAQPHIYPKHIGNLIVPNIDSTKIQQFNSLVSPLFKKYFNNQEINNNLEKIKKSLLSKYFD